MYHLSRWANAHLWQARLLIIGIHVVMTILALRLGLRLFLHGFHFSDVAQILFVGIFLLGWMVYPISRQRSSYVRQKSSDFVLAFSTFLMLTAVGNQIPGFLEINISPKETRATLIVLKEKPESKSAFPLKEVRKYAKNYFKKRLEKLQKEKAEGRQTLLIILTIIGALGLLYLLSGLACSISCNGAEGVAIAVFIAGLAGIVWLTILLIRKITGKRRKMATG